MPHLPRASTQTDTNTHTNADTDADTSGTQTIRAQPPSQHQTSWWRCRAGTITGSALREPSTIAVIPNPLRNQDLIAAQQLPPPHPSSSQPPSSAQVSECISSVLQRRALLSPMRTLPLRYPCADLTLPLRFTAAQGRCPSDPIHWQCPSPQPDGDIHQPKLEGEVPDRCSRHSLQCTVHWASSTSRSPPPQRL